MALNKIQLKVQLKVGMTSIFSNPSPTNNVAVIAEQLATLMSESIDFYVKQGQVTGATSNGGTIVQSQII
ncbi:MAG: hypothetical protein WA775_03065 [Psychroserpens sp.]|uniref:hypothetical protein n=1 Tax=Psychroserpens sp. TaxID=2020870 RepID=UPI003CA97A3B